jgi:hypothetical protein
MQELSIKEELLKIQLLLHENRLSDALKVYENIEKNWELYSKEVRTSKEKDELLRLVEHIFTLLKEKKAGLLEKKKYFELRQKYSKY